MVEQIATARNDVQVLETVQAWRQLLVRGILRAATILGFLVLVLVIYDVHTTDFGQVIPLYLLAYALLALAAFWRGASYRLQCGVVLLLLYGLGFVDTSMYGMSGTGGIFWLTFSVATIFLLGLRWGILALCLSFLSYLGFGVAISFQLLGITADTITHDNLDLISWLSSSVVLTTLGAALLVCFNYLFRHLVNAVTTSQELAGDLAADVAKRKTIEEALQKREQEFKTLVENNPDMIVRYDRQYRYVYVNPAVEKAFGIPKSSILGRSGRELGQSGKEADESENNIRQILDSGREIILETSVRRNGQTEYYLTRGVPEFDSTGSVTSALFILRNITERKLSEQILRRNEELLQAAVRVANIGVFDHDQRTDTVYWSPRQREIHGWGIDEQITLAMFVGLVHPEDRERIDASVRSAHDPAGDGLWDVEHRIIRRDGTLRWLAARSQTFFEDTGKMRHPVRTVGAVLDITERKQHERELEAIATLSAAMRMAPSRAEMGPAILGELSRLLDADGVTIEMIDPMTGDAVIEQARGIWSPFTGSRIPRDQGLNSHILPAANPYGTNQALADAHFAADVELVAEGQVIGFLRIARKNALVESDMRVLGAIADIAANAIHRATLHEAAQRNAENLAALHAIDLAITDSTDLNVTARIIVDQVRARLGVDAADLLVLNSYLNVLEYVAGNGFRSQAIARTHVRVGEGQAGKAVLERSTVHIPCLAVAGDTFSRAELLIGDAFVSYWAVPLVAKGIVRGVLEVFHRTPLNPEAEWTEFLGALAGQAAIAIDNAELFQSLQRTNIDLALAYDATIEGWSRALDLRDRETEGHTQRVTELTLQLARAMDTDPADLINIRRGALLHDIGKMGVPDSILLKHGKLTEAEWEIMRKHPTYAYEMLSPIAYLHSALDIPYRHHEKWDGTGYPNGLKGDRIPLTARMFAVVDVWDAMCSDRPYRPALSKDEAREYIRTQAGKHFDPQVTEVFLSLIAKKP